VDLGIDSRDDPGTRAAPTRARRRFRGAEVGVWPFIPAISASSGVLFALCCPPESQTRKVLSPIRSPLRVVKTRFAARRLSLSLCLLLFFSTMRDVEFFLYEAYVRGRRTAGNSLLGPSVNGRQRLRTRYRATRRAIRAMISQGAHIVPGKVHSSRSRGSRVRSVSSFLSLSVALPPVRSASCSRYTHARRGGAMRRCVTDSRASASARGHY